MTGADRGAEARRLGRTAVEIRRLSSWNGRGVSDDLRWGGGDGGRLRCFSWVVPDGCEERSPADGNHCVLVSAVPPDDAYDFDAEALAHLDSVYRVAVWLSGSPDEAQDLTQDTYERALRGREGFVRTNMRAWLLTILRHHFLNLRRRDRIVDKAPLEEAVAVDEPVPEVPIAVMRQDLQAALAKLSSDVRLPLLLADVEELSMTEIASTLGWPVGTVKSRLWRARRELGALLRDYGVARA